MFYILFNPKANNGNAERELDSLPAGFTSDCRKINVLENSDYKSIIMQLKEEDSIVIAGGDGTLNHFINDVDTDNIHNPVYFFSIGTGNDFKNDINQKENREPVMINEYLRNLPTVCIDDREYKFINGIGYGIDGYCCEEGDRLRARSAKPVNYTLIAIKGILSKFKSRNAVITVDGVSREFRKVWLAPTMLGRFYGGGMMVTPRQDRLNKEHTVTNAVMYGRGRLITLMRFPAIFKGEHVKYTDMMSFMEGHEITVEFDSPCALQVDGETFLNVKKYTVKYA